MTSIASAVCGHETAPAHSGVKRSDLPESKGVRLDRKETEDCHRDNYPFRSARRLITGQGITAPILPDD